MACDDDAVKRLLPVLVAVLGMAACTGGGDELADSTDARGRTVPSSPTSPQSPPVSQLDSGGSSPVTVEAVTGELVTVESTETSDVVPAASVTARPIVEIPGSGVPGLDSDDAFCAAWSRFGGSWQVLLVGSNFLGDAERVATWEIASADIVEAAYADLIAHFPDQLASEAEIVADAYFGALHRRAATAGASLGNAGADGAVVQRLGRAWLEALAQRDQFDPDLAFEIPEDLRELVDRAVDDFRSQRVEFHLDPSMTIGAETPLTDGYLETACPDQGTLSGQEVDPG